MQNLTIDSISNCSDYNEKDSDIEFEKNEVGEMVPKRKNTGPWKVPEVESTPTPKGIFILIVIYIYIYIAQFSRRKNFIKLNNSKPFRKPIRFKNYKFVC